MNKLSKWTHIFFCSTKIAQHWNNRKLHEVVSDGGSRLVGVQISFATAAIHKWREHETFHVQTEADQVFAAICPAERWRTEEFVKDFDWWRVWKCYEGARKNALCRFPNSGGR